MPERGDVEEVVAYVSRELRELEAAFARRGLRVVGVTHDSDNGRPFPDLLVVLDCEDVEGRRVLRRYLGSRGVLEDPGEVGRGLYIWSQEVTRSQLAALPSVADADAEADER